MLQDLAVGGVVARGRAVVVGPCAERLAETEPVLFQIIIDIGTDVRTEVILQGIEAGAAGIGERVVIAVRVAVFTYETGFDQVADRVLGVKVVGVAEVSEDARDLLVCEREIHTAERVEGHQFV